jgi:predicted alpha/beta hydrolase family esterase
LGESAVNAHRPRRFLVLHGWQNRRPQHHWQWQLVETLRQEGEQVLYPQLPDPDRPSLDTWLEVVHAELAQLGSGERIVIAHSLAVPLWLYLTSELSAAERVDRVLLVSPPSPNFLRAHDEVTAFADAPMGSETIEAAATTNRLVASDNDPYCPETAAVAYAALQLPCDAIADGGHIDPEAGYGEWPSLTEWCHDGRTRLTRRL